MRAGGRPASGAVELRVGRRTVAGGLDGGAARLVIPAKLAPGRHRVAASYAGARGVRPSAASTRLTVVKARPRLAARMARRKVARRHRAVIRVVAKLPARSTAVPVGQLVIRDGSRIVRVARLRRSDRGRARIVLPRLGRGAHYLRVSLSGGPRQRASTTRYRLLRVR